MKSFQPEFQFIWRSFMGFRTQNLDCQANDYIILKLFIGFDFFNKYRSVS